MKNILTWEQHFNECARMGVSKKTYCEQNNLSYQLFFYHQRKLMERNPNLGFQEIQFSHPLNPIHQVEDEPKTVLQVQFTNGNTLLFSDHLLERVFCLLQGQSE